VIELALIGWMVVTAGEVGKRFGETFGRRSLLAAIARGDRNV